MKTTLLAAAALFTLATGAARADEASRMPQGGGGYQHADPHATTVQRHGGGGIRRDADGNLLGGTYSTPQHTNRGDARPTQVR